VVTPAAWDTAQPEPGAAGQGEWWRRFGDDKLDALVARVLARDNNLAAAAITLRRARIQARFAVINPQISGGIGYTDTQPLNNTTSTVTVGGYVLQTGGYGGQQSVAPSLSASYEIDLFDALGAQKDVAKWEARATQEDLDSTRLSLIGTTVDLYFQLAYLNGEIARTGEDIRYAQTELDLVRVLVRAGDDSALDESLAAQSVASAQASLHALVEQRIEARNSLNLLLNGETAAPEDEAPALPAAEAPAVDAGLPAQLLGRRPDLKAAEMRLREQLATVDQTRLSLYPTLSLTGSLGTSSAKLADLFANPVGSLGADLALPFLNYDQARLNVGVSRATYDLAVVNFRQTLYQALTDVNNALSQRQQYALQAADLARALDESRALERLDEIRYRAGSVPLKTLLDDQEARRQAESALAGVRLNQFRAYVALCKALGGGAGVG
jgi:NodT family efflux transporter outer membrane factor (OMF) lipoprotein